MKKSEPKRIHSRKKSAMRNGAPCAKEILGILKLHAIRTTLDIDGFVKLVRTQRVKQRHMKARLHVPSELGQWNISGPLKTKRQTVFCTSIKC